MKFTNKEEEQIKKCKHLVTRKTVFEDGIWWHCMYCPKREFVVFPWRRIKRHFAS